MCFEENYRQQIRPFLPGEHRNNPDGSRSTEILATVQDPSGAWANVPSLWMMNGRPVEFPNDDMSLYAAQRYEDNTHMRFPRYLTMQQAVDDAVARSAAGGASERMLAVPIPQPKPVR